jgi:hypothetical protein
MFVFLLHALDFVDLILGPEIECPEVVCGFSSVLQRRY